MRKLVVLLLAGTAHAGGLARPNGISARGAGMGGAFAAWADDATAAYFDPAALTEVDPQATIGGELVLGPRSYTPLLDDGTHAAQQKTTVVAPVPAAGAVGRFTTDDRPSAITFGGGIWNTFGGSVAFPKTGQPALDSLEDAVIEANLAIAWRVSDRLSLGATARVGLGLFSLQGTSPDATLSATGVGLGAALAAQVRPTDDVRIAAVWRSPMTVSTSGSGTIDVGAGAMQETISHDQPWPQQATLGVGVRAAPALRLAAQVDWTQWSAVRELTVHFPASPVLEAATTYREDWNDSWTVRAGADYVISDTFAVRGGAYVDTNAVPDRTIERQYLDSNKLGVAGGASLTLSGWRVDAAVDFVAPSTRTVPNNTAATMGFPADRNKAPGDYRGMLVTFELAAGHRF